MMLLRSARAWRTQISDQLVMYWFWRLFHYHGHPMHDCHHYFSRSSSSLALSTASSASRRLWTSTLSSTTLLPCSTKSLIRPTILRITDLPSSCSPCSRDLVAFNQSPCIRQRAKAVPNATIVPASYTLPATETYVSPERPAERPVSERVFNTIC